MFRADRERRSKELQALSEARAAEEKIDQHIDECSRRYEQLREEGKIRYADLRKDGERRYEETVARMDAQDAALTRIFFTILSGLGAVSLLALEAVMRAYHP